MIFARIRSAKMLLFYQDKLESCLSDGFAIVPYGYTVMPIVT